MKRTPLVLVGCVLLLVTAVPASAGDSTKVLEFENMAAVTGPFVGTANPIRGVPGGGLPWVISSGEGELKADGSLEVHVRGLVLADAAPVPPRLRGINPIKTFKAIVSCLSIDRMGKAITVNRSTGLFPASMHGDSEVEDTVSLPNPCFAPIVFVTSPASPQSPMGNWFAVSSAPFEFETMIGNSGPFSGRMGAPIQGVPPAGAPWRLRSAEGSLDQEGNLEVHVRGLVLTSTGTNPVDHFRAVISCLTIDTAGKAAVKTARTDLFPATVPGGDSDIETTVKLPSPCFVPLVFVTSPGGAFFAVTGVQP